MPQKKEFKTPYIGIDTDEYGIIYTETGDYSVIINFNNSILQHSADIEEYYSFHSTFSNIIKTIGSGYTIQKHDIITRKVYQNEYETSDFLSKEHFKNFQGREYNYLQTNLVITKNVKRGAFYKYNKREFNRFKLTVAKVHDILSSNGLNPRIFSEEELKVYIKRMFAFDFINQKYSLNNFKVDEKQIFIGDNIIKNISLVDVDEVNLPNAITPYKNVHDLGYSFPVDIVHFLIDLPSFDTILYNQVIVIPDQNAELIKLNRKKLRHESMPDPANDISVRDINQLLSDIAEDGRLVVYSHFNIAIKSTTEHINTITNFINTALFNIGVTPSKNAYNQLEIFRACFPGNASELRNYDKYLTTSDAAICFLFKEKLLNDEDSKFKIFFSDRQGIPVAIDTSDLPVEEGRINNRNKFVLGPSGSGKSFLMNHLVRQYYLYSTDLVIVDVGHSYSGICNYYNGKYITYKEDEPITMNPFMISENEYNEEKKEFIKSLIGVIWKGSETTLNQVEDTVLGVVIEAYFRKNLLEERSKNLSFNSFYEYSLEKIKEIIETAEVPFNINEYKFVLKKFYKGGQFETILNEQSDKSLFDENLIVFEIDAIKDHKILFPITTIIIMDVFIQKMRMKQKRKALIIEEAWKAIASPMMAGYILYLYKTVRKFWGEAIVVTQELDDIISNEIVKESIINNSDTICLLDQSKFKDHYDQVSNLLSLTDIEKKKIFTVNKLDNKSGRGKFKEVYIKRGNTGEVYGVEVSDYEYIIFTTERKEKDALQKYVDQYGNYLLGVKKFVEDLRDSRMNLSDFISEMNTKVSVI